MKSLTTVLAVLMLGVGCETHVRITDTRLEDISARSRVLAIAARNLDDAMRTRTATPTEQEVAQYAAKFHNESQSFARESARRTSTEAINDRYEALIDAWLLLKDAFPKVKSDALLTETYQRVVHEWDRLARATGYSNAAYENRKKKK